DEMLPSLDPSIRQFVRFLLQNRHFAYGFAGFCAYALLIHLYVLL
uniref:Uncharacterized protein n=1 Tax=Caenorhabditis japonica TaxID=281687 RepID=A0A8R1IW26_CAEJA